MDGIVFIAFGRDYERLARKTIAYSRKFTDMEMTLFTNVIPKRQGRYDCNVVYLKMKDRDNREIKTRLNEYSPYDRTLYLDVDAIIQRKGIEKIFDFEGDICLNTYLHWEKGVKCLNIYRRAMGKFNVNLPLSIYNGAFILFKKRKTHAFFQMWHTYWVKFGKQREMPPLACAVKNSGVSVSPLGVKVAVDSLDPEATLQHDCKGFLEKFGFPHYISQTPGDSPNDFRWS